MKVHSICPTDTSNDVCQGERVLLQKNLLWLRLYLFIYLEDLKLEDKRLCSYFVLSFRFLVSWDFYLYPFYFFFCLITSLKKLKKKKEKWRNEERKRKLKKQKSFLMLALKLKKTVLNHFNLETPTSSIKFKLWRLYVQIQIHLHFL